MLGGTWAGVAPWRTWHGLLCAYIFFWYFAKGIMKNVPDYEGDRAAGLRTIPALMPTRHAAALVAAATTAAVYLAFPALVLVTSIPDRLLPAGVMAAPALANMWRMAAAVDRYDFERVGQADMYVSVAFLAALLICARPGLVTVLIAGTALMLMALSDLAGSDSRGAQHLEPLTTQEGTNGIGR